MLVAGICFALALARTPLDTCGIPGAAPAPPAAPSPTPPLPRAVSIVGSGRAGLPPRTCVAVIGPLVGRGGAEIRINRAIEVAVVTVLRDRSAGSVVSVLGPSILAAPLRPAISRDPLAVSAPSTAAAATTAAAALAGALVGITRLVAPGRGGPRVAVFRGCNRPVAGGERLPVPGRLPGRFPSRPAGFVAGATTVGGLCRLPGRRRLVTARNAEFGCE